MLPTDCFLCLRVYGVRVQKLPVVVTILNELWSVSAVRQYEHQYNSVEFLAAVDSVVRLYKRLLQAARVQEEQDEQGEEETSK